MGNILFINHSEQTLLERLRKNDSVAQRQLFDTYQKKLLTVCFRYLNDEDEALDALNRSFLKIFEKIHQYKAEAKLATWLQRITINTCLDGIKANKKYKHTFIQTSEFDLYGEPDESHNNINEWWETACTISAEVLYQMIEELPPATRTVFNLYAMDGFTHPQISEQLKISTGTSKWHLNNARSILKEKVTQLISNQKNNHGTREAKDNR